MRGKGKKGEGGGDRKGEGGNTTSGGNKTTGSETLCCPSVPRPVRSSCQRERLTPFNLAGCHTLGNKSQRNSTNGEKQFSLIWLPGM